MKQRHYRGFDICIHAARQGKDQCLVMTDIAAGGLSWGRSQRTRFLGDFAQHEDEEMREAMAMVDRWSGRRGDGEAVPDESRPEHARRTLGRAGGTARSAR